MVDDLMTIVPLAGLNLLAGLKTELLKYLALAVTCEPLNREDVDEYSESLLTWWRNNNPSIPSWAIAARAVFAMSPSSAECERIFSLVKNTCMFGVHLHRLHTAAHRPAPQTVLHPSSSVRSSSFKFSHKLA